MVLTVLGAFLILLGGLLPYGDCRTCRVIAPSGVSLAVWFPGSAGIFVSAASSLIAAVRVQTRKNESRYTAGFLTAVGLLTIAWFLVWAILVRSPFGGPFGLGGIVGAIGGVLVLLSGTRLKTEVENREPST
jgi:hypothetical protein